ncbi:zinc finger (C2H2 type) family protein isoform X2 [Carex rostrata]
MGKKKKRAVEKVFCYYCDREFDDEKILVQHQKAKHFKCHVCHKKLSTASGMTIHVLQVHKESVTKVPNAKPERESTEIEIFGMQGVPPQILAAHYGESEEDPSAKMTKVEAPLTFTHNHNPLNTATAMGLPPTYGAVVRPPPPIFNPAFAVRPPPMWQMLPRGPQQPWFHQQQPLSIPVQPASSTLTQPLFPIQNIIPPTTTAAAASSMVGLHPAFQVTPPMPPPHVNVSQPLFPIATTTVAVASAPPPPPTTTTTNNNGSSAGPVNANTPAAGNQGGSYTGMRTYATGPDTGGTSTMPPPEIANKAPTPAGQPGASEVYLVWDDEAMSMEERRMSLVKYQVHDETSQVSHFTLVLSLSYAPVSVIYVLTNHFNSFFFLPFIIESFCVASKIWYHMSDQIYALFENSALFPRILHD